MSETTTKPRAMAGRAAGAWAGLACSAALFASGLYVALGGPVGTSSTGRHAAMAPTRCAAPSQSPEVSTRAIEDIRVGDRVLAGNPEMHGDEPGSVVDPSAWRRIELTQPRVGGSIEIVLLRPATWVKALGVGPGATIELDLAEMDAAGPSRVVAVGRCPALKPGSGRLVTGTFTHVSDTVLDVRIEGVGEPVGATAKHRFYSVDRRGFVASEALRDGERLCGVEGTARVISIRPRVGSHRVFNLEVEVEHVYHVTRHGVLVHNAYAPKKAPNPNGRNGTPAHQSGRSCEQQAGNGRSSSTTGRWKSS